MNSLVIHSLKFSKSNKLALKDKWYASEQRREDHSIKIIIQVLINFIKK